MNPAIVFPLTERHSPKLVPVSVQRRMVSPEAVRSQLSRILQSPGFARARRMRQFLEFIVGETLAGRAAQLCEYAIGVAVFERDESFAPALNPIVRNDARRLRHKLLEYYQRSRYEHNSDGVIIEVPTGGYVPVFRCVSGPQSSFASRQYHLRVNLIRAADGAEVWAGTCDFELRENLGVQLEIRGPDMPALT
jgi:hypothetical protein